MDKTNIWKSSGDLRKMRAVKYVVKEYLKDPFNSIYIEHRGETGWAIIQRGTCLNKEGKWEFEPMPSSRTEEFFQRTRFKDEQEAFEFFEKVVKEDVDSI